MTRLVEEWREHLDENFVVGAVLTDPSKAFGCIAHDFLIAKLAAYGFLFCFVLSFYLMSVIIQK